MGLSNGANHWLVNLLTPWPFMGPQTIKWTWTIHVALFVYGLKREVWGRVGPDPWAELQVDQARGPRTWSLPGAQEKSGTCLQCV